MTSRAAVATPLPPRSAAERWGGVGGAGRLGTTYAAHPGSRARWVADASPTGFARRVVTRGAADGLPYHESRCMTRNEAHPITVEVVRNAIVAYADEMANALVARPPTT